LVHRLFDPRIEAVMNEYRAVVASFIVKEPQEPASKLDMHADSSVVDESHFMSANLWCPLVDTSPINGGLRIIPGSEHHYFPIRVYSCRAGVTNHPFAEVKRTSVGRPFNEYTA
jgi:ectoine hydroxylase-related dioxygenase (phytanoyl-CoA dioxygenase family)